MNLMGEWMSEQLGLTVLAIIFGLIWGSFLNVCIYRIPRGESVVIPRSRCLGCQRQVRFYENIPVLSYIILGRKCAGCGVKISMQYPLVELLTAFLSYATFAKFGSGWPYPLYFFLLVTPIIVITFIDLEHQIIPDIISLPGIGAGILTSLILNKPLYVWALKQSLLGILVGGGILFVIAFLYEKIRKEEGLGGGDIKLAAMFGAFLGWKAVLMILLFASCLGSLIGVSYILISRQGMKVAIPFGPFLAGGAMIYLFYGPQILGWYLHRLGL